MERNQEIQEAIRSHPDCLASQGGGLVVWDEFQKAYFFVLPPDWGNYKVGDAMPEEWGTGPQAMAS
jgi:hypothetical protein